MIPSPNLIVNLWDELHQSRDFELQPTTVQGVVMDMSPITGMAMTYANAMWKSLQTVSENWCDLTD